MKIFAREGSTLYATLTSDEAAHLEGFPGEWQREQARRGKIRAGQEIDLAVWYQATRTLAEEHDRIVRLRGQAADAVEDYDRQLAAIGEPRIES